MIDWQNFTEILLPMKTKQFDALVEQLLKEADGNGGFLSKLGSMAKTAGRGLAQVYNAPATFAKGAAAFRSAVQSGEIPLKDKEKEAGKGTMAATGDRPKQGDLVNVRLRGLGLV